MEFEAKWSGYAALFDYTDAFATAPEGRSSLAWLVPFARPFRGAIAAALIASALQMMLPVFIQVIVDKVLVDGDIGLLHSSNKYAG